MRRIVYAVIRIILFLIFKIFFRFEVRGRENIPPHGGVIVAANHTSYLDPPVIGTALTRQAHYMARHDLFSLPIWGGFLRFVNAFPIHQKGFDRHSIKEAIGYLKRGEVLILFPEGARSFTGEFLPPLSGVGMIAWQARTVIVPAYIKGSNKALPRKAKYIRAHKVEVIFGKPFSPQEEKLFSSDLPHHELYSRISRHIMDEIAKLKSSLQKDFP